MNLAQTARVLAEISVFDRRTFDETDVQAWHTILGDLDVEDCSEAVRQHFRTSTDWLMPAHVHRGAVAVRARRARERDEDGFVPVAGSGRWEWDALPREVQAQAAVEAASIHPECPPWDRRAVIAARLVVDGGPGEVTA